MHKAFKYRLYPTAAQETAMKAILEECRWLYNHFLDERKTVYEQTGHSPSLYEQNLSLPGLKQQRPGLAKVHSQVLQNVAVRVDLAMGAFFRRVRAGEKEPGYPRFRGKGRYDSFC
jgi:putative transposase